jgi:phosphatidylglycerol:prolipoprotein diacylglycerol transferase
VLPSFDVGTWHLYTYALANAVALLVAGMYAFHRLLRLDVPSQVVVRGLFYTVVAGFAGVFAVRLVPTIQAFLRTGSLAWSGGSSFAGAALGGGLAMGLYYRRQAVPLGRAFDLIVLPLPLGQAIGRLGCLAAGCCFGRPTASPLGMYLPNGEGIWAVRYPTQLMAAGADLLILAALLAVERIRVRRRARPFDGLLILLYLILYCLKRFSLEFLRGDAIPLLGPVSWVHLYTVAAIALALALIVRYLNHPAPGIAERQLGPPA